MLFTLDWSGFPHQNHIKEKLQTHFWLIANKSFEGYCEASMPTDHLL
jgi:hypothetical protein